ncbi:hypothetical protein [Paenibacillus glycanilyticus]|uniref:Uncharacterized protein n=1 Tax=Paenibacillus glycanilyticus TaxID=126569 RepID=A0ABQ6GGE5_9BACL|nr:hypothetical protein [Paenibacillus glycanilyticus]GLX70024.1 hypothetical protein MU1_43700 [Paenibacillus glycanilyticus]
MKETLLIKHAVGGRTFVDSSKQAVPYQVAHEEGQWRFTVVTPRDPGIDEILAWKQELNVFVFRSYTDGSPMLKIWYSVLPDTVNYVAAEEKLTFAAGSCIEYVPDEYGYKL